MTIIILLFLLCIGFHAKKEVERDRKRLSQGREWEKKDNDKNKQSSNNTNNDNDNNNNNNDEYFDTRMISNIQHLHNDNNNNNENNENNNNNNACAAFGFARNVMQFCLGQELRTDEINDCIFIPHFIPFNGDTLG